MIKSWLMVFIAYVAISTIFSVIDIIGNRKNAEDKKALVSIGNMFFSVLIFILFTSPIWGTILDGQNYPNSCRNVNYNAPAAIKPTVEEPSSNSRYKKVVEVESEAILGEKQMCRSFLFGNNRETIIRKAEPTKYAIKTVDNPNYVEPKPIYTAPPAPQRGRSCPITTCCDGTCSSSVGRGTCSWHGGVCSY